MGAQVTLAQLRALVALADTLSFREAARRLEISQPSVSAAIGSLEQAFGSSLATRNSRRVELTAFGREVAEGARRIITEVEELAALAPGAQLPGRGPVRARLGIIPTVAPYILAPVLRTAARRWPELALDVTESRTARLLEGLVSGDLEASLLALPLGAQSTAEVPAHAAGTGFTEVPLYTEDFVLLLPPEHPLAGKSDLPTSVLREIPLLLLEEGHCLSGQVLDVCRQVGAATEHPARAASLTTIAQLVAAGMGATLLPETALPVETRKGKLSVARFHAPAPGRTIGMVTRRDALVSLSRRLEGLLRASLDRPGFAGRILPGPTRG
ncbi:MAG TPA: hydrogen peroxide-inducible genes activator [Acidimicrobiales bacterium]|nr:hydrogen peroxide-inducible genes activator [Acidimicrobiales bacterium]